MYVRDLLTTTWSVHSGANVKVHESAEAVRAFLECEDIAHRAAQPASSAHLLLALFTFPNRARVLLSERGIDEDAILGAIRVVEEEPKRTVARLRDRAREIAASSGSEAVDSLHVLIAITRMRDAFAYRLLDRTGISLTAIRNLAVSFITGNMPRRYRALAEPPALDTPAISRRVVSPRVRELDVVREARPEPIIDRSRSAPPAPPAARPEPEPELASVQAAEAPAPAARAPALPAPPEGYLLPLEDVAPNLAACAVDLTAMARDGSLDMVVGRDEEMEFLVDILGKRRSNNPVLVGPPGVGKTAIVEGLAVKIARGDEDVQHLLERRVVSLDTGGLVAGTSLRGAFSERLGAIKAEVAAAEGKIVVFIDELHTLIGAGGSGDGPMDAANELKAALARGEFPCIGATTTDEYKKYIEKDPALERRFSPVEVNEPSVDEAILIVEGAIGAYAEHHRIDYHIDAVHSAVTLSHRYITERQLPDKAFAVLDLAGSRARRRGGKSVERMDVARVVHEWSRVPLERLADVDADRFTRAEAIIGERFIGHGDVVQAVCRAIRRGYAGFNAHRPIGSFLFLGPTGVGKTELVKVLAEFLFGRRDAVVRVDMSELSEAHSVARLLGAQPGYVGFENGGQLTEALRKRPFQIVLFDEVEKAHRDVHNVLLQLLDEGHLTDSRGRRVSFANTVVVLTSNLGADALGATAGRALGFGRQEVAGSGSSQAVLEVARANLAPELWGRLDERLVFMPLDRAQVREIAELQLRESARLLFAERELTMEWDDDLLDFLLDHGGFSPEKGARGMRQAIQTYVEGPVAERILTGELQSGECLRLRASQGRGVDVLPATA